MFCLLGASLIGKKSLYLGSNVPIHVAKKPLRYSVGSLSHVDEEQANIEFYFCHPPSWVPSAGSTSSARRGSWAETVASIVNPAESNSEDLDRDLSIDEPPIPRANGAEDPVGCEDGSDPSNMKDKSDPEIPIIPETKCGVLSGLRL